MKQRGVLIRAIALAAWVGMPIGAVAQEPATRAETLQSQREEKAKNLTPPALNRAERTLMDLESGRLFERLLNPAEGLYPKMGNGCKCPSSRATASAPKSTGGATTFRMRISSVSALTRCAKTKSPHALAQYQRGHRVSEPKGEGSDRRRRDPEHLRPVGTAWSRSRSRSISDIRRRSMSTIASRAATRVEAAATR